jgi:hypothetical protein
VAVEPPSAAQERAWTASLRLLDRIVEQTKRLNAPLVVVVFPMEVQLSDAKLALYRKSLGLKLDASALSGSPQNRLGEYARRHDIPFIDLLPAFRRANGRSLFLRNRSISLDWVHLSTAGHALAAEEIFRAFSERGLTAGSRPSRERGRSP